MVPPCTNMLGVFAKKGSNSLYFARDIKLITGNTVPVESKMQPLWNNALKGIMHSCGNNAALVRYNAVPLEDNALLWA